MNRYSRGLILAARQSQAFSAWAAKQVGDIATRAAERDNSRAAGLHPLESEDERTEPIYRPTAANCHERHCRSAGFHFHFCAHYRGGCCCDRCGSSDDRDDWGA